MTLRRVAVLLLWTALLGLAHVGSPDIYLEGSAGPYPLFVTVRPPPVIPGIAELEVRTESTDVGRISAVPLPMSGPGAALGPVPDELQRSKLDAQYFTGALWMMAPGSWQIKLIAAGTRGAGTLSVPIPAAAISTRPMKRSLGAMLFVLMTFLVLGIVAIAGAAVRESKLDPGAQPDVCSRERGRRAMAIAFCVAVAALLGGRLWWDSESALYAAQIYRPMQMKASLEGNDLKLYLQDPGWLNSSKSFSALPVLRSIDDLVLDHNHLMHLYMVREPGFDVIEHLHPELVNPGLFDLPLPSLPAGKYKLYADIVHASGFPETLVSSVSIPSLQGRALAGDDSATRALPWQLSRSGAAQYVLPDGYRMRWVNASGSVAVKRPTLFRFELLDAQGKKPSDMNLYMGMTGHAAFIKTDGTAFAHIHPNGSVSMAAFMQAQGGHAMPSMDPMQGMTMDIPNAVSFPYGLPSAGRYRVVVQMKHGSAIESAVFDLTAMPK